MADLAEIVFGYKGDKMKKALISGISGQDGSYLAELLLEKGYEVHGIVRRSSTINTERIDHIFDPESKQFIHYGDLYEGLDGLLYEIQPDVVFNLASMSHVRVSFDVPIYTADINAIGPLRILEGIRKLKLKHTRFYQASSSEMFGLTPPPQDENTSFNPVSPYGCAKLFAYNITRSYRKGYGIFASNGILFNHESKRRGFQFVTRKITRGAARIKVGLQDKLHLGNLSAKRDWGHSKDYMNAVIMIMEHSEPDDFVVASEHQCTVGDFLHKVFDILDLDVDKYVVIDKSHYRPVEVPSLLGDATKIRKVLGWEPKISFDELVSEMVKEDLKNAEIEKTTRR